MIATNTISFVIRTYNEAAYLGRLLDTIDSQTQITPEREVVVVDSGSTDGTVEIAVARNAILIQIRKEEFDYSKTLNLGIKKSRGDLIVIMSAHAIPCKNDWLEQMISHFRDERVAGVFCRQVPWPDAYWREVWRLERMFGTVTIVHELRGSAVREIPFSNAASCIRRGAWERHNFVLPAAEDMEWATWAVANGYRIIYEASTCVYHSHNETCRQRAGRAIQLEKAADIRMGRRRRSLLTVKQAVGAVLRDIRGIERYPNAKANRLGLVWDAIARSYWFVWDFER